MPDSTYIALLRGLNVGGKNRLDMKSLAAAFEGCGARRVRTYIQSGNVVFDAAPTKAKALGGAVAEALRELHGLDVPVVLRTHDELRTAIAANPFRRHGEAEQKAWHVTFLAELPSKERAAALDPQRSPGDEFKLVGKELFLRCPAGYGRTKLTPAYVDKVLGTLGTVRNWATVLALAELAADGG